MAEIKKSESPERLRDEIRGRLREEMTERLREEMEDAGKEIEFDKKRKAQVALDLSLDFRVLDIKRNKAVKDIEALRKDLGLDLLDIHDAVKDIEALRKDLGLDFLDLLYIHDEIKDIEALRKDLGIPIVSSAEKLNSDSIVIFLSNHKDYTEPEELKKILLQKLSSDKKTILGVEFSSNKFFRDLLNDPTRNLKDRTFYELILPHMNFRETILGLLRVFNNIQQTYSIDRFEIEPFDLPYGEILFGRPLEDTEFGKKRNAQVVENILDLLRTHGDDNLVFYAGTLHVKDLFAEFKEIKESGNKEGIKIDNITVYLPPLDRVICDFIDIMRGTHTRQTYMNSLRK